MKTIIIIFIASAILGAIIGFGRNREDSFGRFTRLLWFIYTKGGTLFLLAIAIALIFNLFNPFCG